MNTAVYFLRAKQIGLSLAELEEIEIGFLYDIIIENGNDGCEYNKKATQSDIDKLLG